MSFQSIDVYINKNVGVVAKLLATFWSFVFMDETLFTFKIRVPLMS